MANTSVQLSYTIARIPGQSTVDFEAFSSPFLSYSIVKQLYVEYEQLQMAGDQKGYIQKGENASNSYFYELSEGEIFPLCPL